MNSSMMLLLRLMNKKIYNVPCQINSSWQGSFSSVDGERSAGVIRESVPVIGNELAGRNTDNVGIRAFVIRFRPVYDNGKVLAA